MAQQKINNKMNMPRPSWMWIYGVIIIFIVGYWMFGSGNGVPVKSDWNTVAQMIEQGDVEKIQVVNRDLAEIYLKKEAADRYRKDAADKRFRNMPETGVQLTFNIGSVDTFRQDLDKVIAESGNDVVLVYENRENSWTSILLQMLPWVIIIGGWFFLMSRMSRGAGGGSGGIMNVGKARAQVFDKENSKKVTFKDVAGLEEAKVEIMEIVDFLKKPDKYKSIGAKIPKGALLVGPPGTGKTLLAKAVAGEANVPFLSISGSDFVEMFVGVGASRVRDLFEQAKQKAPCILFIDEIDAIGRARGKNAGFSGNDERENTQPVADRDGRFPDQYGRDRPGGDQPGRYSGQGADACRTFRPADRGGTARREGARGDFRRAFASVEARSGVGPYFPGQADARLFGCRHRQCLQRGGVDRSPSQ